MRDHPSVLKAKAFSVKRLTNIMSHANACDHLNTPTPPTDDIAHAYASDQFITTAALAAHWCVAPGSLRNQRVSGRGLSFVKIGRSVRYSLVEVRRFEAAHLMQNTTVGGAR